MREPKPSLTLLVVWLGLLCLVPAANAEPLTGAAFERAVQSQNVTFQDTLRAELIGVPGCFVTGPLGGVEDTSIVAYKTVRIVCSDLQRLESALERLEKSTAVHVQSVSRFLEKPATVQPTGYRGVIVDLVGGRQVSAQTFQQLRFLVWARSNVVEVEVEKEHRDSLAAYARAVSHYLYMIDLLEDSTTPPQADAFALLPERDLYAPAPPYVIEGYQNYKDFMHSHAGIYTDFARGVLGFVPTDSLMIMLKQNLPQVAYPNKEYSKFQEEMEEFFARDGDPIVLSTLTRAVFDTLRPGEYFFAVGLNGTIRFGRELLREEVEEIEAATGHKVARANHAFLFPGEPLLTAGAFFLGDSTRPRLRSVNAQSGHYFYSNVSETIREDIAVRSNEYLLTLGHFFVALDALGIPYDSVLITKF